MRLLLLACCSYVSRSSFVARRSASGVHYSRLLVGGVPSRLFSTSSSSDDADRLVSTQASISREKLQSPPEQFSSEARHVEHQKKVFDAMSGLFEEDIPGHLIPVYEQLASQVVTTALLVKQKQQDDNIDDKRTLRLLDVACGTGVLFPFLVKAAAASASRVSRLEITGVDLSSKMVVSAQKRADALTTSIHDDDDSSLLQVDIRVVESDVVNFQPPSDDEGDTNTNDYYYFDAIIANACFGNFWDSTVVLQALSQWLKPNQGCLLVTHPLGSDFVRQLHQTDPSTVPHLLPTYRQFAEQLRYLPWQLQDVQHELMLVAAEEKATLPFYFATLWRVRHVALAQMMRLRGVVDMGYGRGGKKLGFPTANLPARLFQDALQTVKPGVYFGWAVLEKGNYTDRRYKAVVNVGYSPTFEGQENAEKIVEAHLILNEPIDDFYGETMRLQLHGFLRPEIKFPSFPALIAQIKADVQEAKMALDLKEPYGRLREDPFLSKGTTAWVGSSGGDESASWEFQDTDAALDEL